MAWLIRGLLFLAGIITGMMISREDHSFEVIQMMVAIGLFTLLAAILAFLPAYKKRRSKSPHQTDSKE